MKPQTLTRLTQSLGIGRIIISASGEVLEANESALHTLGRLRLSARTLLRGRVEGSDSAIVGRQGGWTSIRIEARPGPVVVHHRSLEETGGCVLMILDPQVLPVIGMDLLRSIFKLTPAEVRVAQLVMTGATNASIAKLLKIGPGTARTHIKSLYLKTGTHRQPHLTALLWRMCFLPYSAGEAGQPSVRKASA